MAWRRPPMTKTKNFPISVATSKTFSSPSWCTPITPAPLDVEVEIVGFTGIDIYQFSPVTEATGAYLPPTPRLTFHHFRCILLLFDFFLFFLYFFRIWSKTYVDMKIIKDFALLDIEKCYLFSEVIRFSP